MVAGTVVLRPSPRQQRGLSAHKVAICGLGGPECAGQGTDQGKKRADAAQNSILTYTSYITRTIIETRIQGNSR